VSQDERVQILLVDDQPGKLLSYEAMLADLDATLIRAGSASEALQELLRNEIAVVLIDVCMPGLDGFELAAMIRGHPRYRNTAIILVSAVLVNDVHRLKGYHSGAMDYVGVPVVPEILRAKVAVFADLYRKSRRLERVNEELEQRVEERTAALRASDRRKDEFLAILAHELRNPLAPMLNSLHLLRSPGDHVDRTQALEVMDRQLGHLVRLVDDLLDVSRITTGKLDLRTEPVKIHEALEHAVERVESEIQQKGQLLEVEVSGDDGLVVEGDEMRLTQIFSNLLHNASKFTGRGGKIAVRALRTGSEIEVSVRDTGEGIAPEQLERIYDLFSQGDRSLERRHGGLGIGLTIVKRLVELHGGAVVARSDGPGSGSEFLVRLPLPAVAATELPRADPEEGRPAPQRVLVVDDNRDNLESLSLLLEVAGNEVRTASDGVSAVAAAEAFRPEVVLLDVGMPHMNGYDACRLIRAHDWGRNILIIALTGWGQEEDRARSHAAGFDQHFVKPVDPKALLRYLGRHSAKRDELRTGQPA
jgi:signal transduction histidine kinase